MSANGAILEGKRSPSLKTLLRKYVDLIAQISAANPELARQHQNFFHFLSIEKLASVIRRSMLKFLVLFLRGSNKPQDILKRLNLCMLDPDEAKRMMGETEINILVEEYSSKLKLAGATVDESPKI